MTYCPPNSTVQTYEFTALSADQVLNGGDTNLNCGDCFDMPTSANTCVTVQDNDDSLSGDAYCNEWGDDSSWQIADIMVDGQLVHDDQKIYAEEYYVLHGSDGNCYYLIEIEVAGAAGDDTTDYYTFYGAVPDAGVTLTVAGKGNICGDWMDYKCLSAGLKWDFDDDGKLTIEAEDMALSGYKVDDVAAASGGEVIRLKKSEGEASLTFGADSGTYDLELAYIDENDGEGEIEIWVNGALIHAIALDQNNNGNGNDWSSISTVAVQGVQINQGDEIVLKGTKDCWEYARIDALTFCAASNTPPDALDDIVGTTEDAMLTVNLLGNDSDPDGDALTVTSVAGTVPGDIVLTSTTGRTTVANITAAGIVTINPSMMEFNDLSEGEEQVFNFTYEITDGNGGTDQANAQITITGENDGPTAMNDNYVVGESSVTTLDILSNDTDPEGDELTVTLLSNPVEGQVTLNADGTVTFDTFGQFDMLSDGQTATVEFDYRISDGQFTSDATVTVVIEGEGVCLPHDPVTVTEVVSTPANDFTVGFTSPDDTKTGTESFGISVNFGDLSDDRYNVVFVVDVSGSTAVETVDGIPVLDAEIAAINALHQEMLELGLPDGHLTVTIVPFNSTAQPTTPVDTNGDFIPDSTPLFMETFGDDETLAADGSDVSGYLDTLISGGETNYFFAVNAASQAVLGQDPFPFDENNIVYFLTDGNPFPEPANQEVFLLQLGGFANNLKSIATVHGIAIGDVVDPAYVNVLDNTGGAVLVSDAEAATLGITAGEMLDDAMRDAPFGPGTIVSADLTITDAGGTVIDSFAFTGADFTSTAFGYELAIEDVSGLGILVTDTSTATLDVALDDTGDGVADATVSMAVDIEGLMPESFDFA